MSKHDLEKQFIEADTVQHFSKAGAVKKTVSTVGNLLSEAEKQIALEKFRAGQKMSKAENEAIGLYHEIGGGPKLKKPAGEYTYETRNDPRFETATKRILTPMDLYKKVGVPLVGDRAAAGKVLTSVEGKELANPVQLEGGSEFMMNNPDIWASDKGVITKIANQVRKAAETGDEVLGINVVGSPTNVDFNKMVTKVLTNNLDLSSLRKKDIKEFNAEIRKVYPSFVGLEHPELEAQLTAPKMGNLRTLFVDRMNQAKYQEVGFPDVTAARISVTEPKLLDVPTGTAGFTIGKFDPERLIIESPEIAHETYPVHAGGEYVGGFEAPINFKDIFQEFDESRRLLGADPTRDLRSFTFQSPAIQNFDQEWLDRVMPTYEQIIKSKRYAKGGKVGKAAGILEEIQKLYNTAEAEKKAETAVKAPQIIMPRSGITDLKNKIRQNKGEYGARRVERAADLVPNLEQQYTKRALESVFDSDNAESLMVVNPKDFEEYAKPLPPYVIGREEYKQHPVTGEMVSYDEYMNALRNIAIDNGYNAVPWMYLKQDDGSYKIRGHEGRHRTRALSDLGDESTLVQVRPYNFREEMPRRTQEEYIDELRARLGLDPQVYPEAFDTYTLPFPEQFKDGGSASLEDEFVKADTFAGGGDVIVKGNPYGKGSGRPVHGQMKGPDWEVVKRAGKLGAKQIGKELTQDTPKQTAIDLAGNFIADTLGMPADIVTSRPEPIKSKATPWGNINFSKSQIIEPKEETHPVFGSETMKRIMKEQGVTSGTERPLTESLLTLATPAVIGKAPKIAKGVGKAVKAMEDLPEGMSVKPVGGQWHDVAREKIEKKLGEVTSNEDVSNWLQTTGRKYMLNRMGTPEDEVRKLLDKDISHIAPEKLSELGRDMNTNDKEMVRAKRRMAGFPSEGEADTAAGKKWEMMTDEWIEPNPASLYQDPRFVESSPWVKNVDPETPIYSNDIGMGIVLRDSGMPEIASALERSIKEGTLKPEQLHKVSMEDAVKLAHDYRVKDEAEVAKDLPKVVDYPEAGMAWHALSHEDPDVLKKILKREGETMQNCIGNYCEDVTEDGTKLFSLRDASGKPHVNIELKPTQGVVFSQIADYLGEEQATKLLDAGWTPKEIVNKYPELKKFRQYRINQIKGKQNEAPIEDYIPYVQDFVAKQGPFTEIRDLGNAGLIDLNRAKEHGVFEIPSGSGKAIDKELYRIFPSEKNPYGGSVLSGQHGVKISPDQMMREALKGMEGDYVSTNQIVDYLSSQEARPVEHSYSKYWKGLTDHKKGGKITKSNLDDEFKINRYMMG